MAAGNATGRSWPRGGRAGRFVRGERRAEARRRPLTGAAGRDRVSRHETRMALRPVTSSEARAVGAQTKGFAPEEVSQWLAKRGYSPELAEAVRAAAAVPPAKVRRAPLRPAPCRAVWAARGVKWLCGTGGLGRDRGQGGGARGAGRAPTRTAPGGAARRGAARRAGERWHCAQIAGAEEKRDRILSEAAACEKCRPETRTRVRSIASSRGFGARALRSRALAIVRSSRPARRRVLVGWP